MNRIRRIGGALALIGFVVVAHAATLEVDDDGGTPFQTIQSAIDAATPGVDDVFVHCGHYQENVVMRSLVSLRGAGAHCTTIDGGQIGRVVDMTDLDVGTTLEGFRITGGQAAVGAGIAVTTGSPVITRNVITGNRAVLVDGLGGYGGGLCISAYIDGEFYPTAPVISRNVFSGNSAESFGGGLDIYGGAVPLIVNNLIRDNIAGRGGGGIDAYDAEPIIANNTIVDNCLGNNCREGGGAINLVESAAEIANNVIAWNASRSYAGGVELFASTASFHSNDAFENDPINYAGVADPTGIDGNLSVDPLFVDQQPASHGYVPRSDSPLVDSGNPTISPADDLRGIVRPLDGNADGNSLPDIGMRENEGLTRLAFGASTDIDWDPANDVATGFNLYRGDLATLVASGVYTQDPTGVDGARQWCGLVTPDVVDLDSPNPGQTYFYLAVAAGVVEGTLGFDSALVERPFDAAGRCP